LEAFSEIKDYVDYDLVLIGRKGWEVDELISKYSVENRVIITGFVEDKDVAAIYKKALCFVFPTLYEGFGIPPVEALANGTPVISSDSSCMKEILRDQAIYFENNNKDELKELLMKVSSLSAKMPHELDSFMLENYDYKKSAQIILDTISID
jgi:glycosyltransferase involved in cell wall biosynthesis